MGCIVPMCVNAVKNPKRSEVSFHMFPKEPGIRKAWIKALGVKNLHVTNKSRICSDHFTEDSLYDTKFGRKLRRSALPTVVLDPTVSASLMICRICLGHGRNMHSLRDYSEAFEQITSISASEGESRRLPQCLCWECAARLTGAASLRAKALLSDGLLRDLLKPDTFIRIGDVKKINTKHFGLKTSLIQKHYDSNHFDYHINDTFAGPDGSAVIENNENTDDSSFNDEIILEQSNNDDDSTDKVTYVNKINDNITLYKEHNYSNVISTVDEVENNKDNTVEAEEFDETSEMSEVGESNEDKLTNNWNIEVEKLSKTITIIPFTVKSCTKKKQVLKRHRSAIDSKPQPNVNLRISKEIDTEYFDITALTNEQQILDVEKRQESSAYINAPFKCDVCYTGMKDVEVFKRHMLKHSDKAGPYECMICKIRKRTKTLLKHHWNLSHREEYKCRKCGFVTRIRHMAQKHIDIHTGLSRYNCDLCGIVFERGTSYLGHRRLYHLTDFVCELCGYTFLSQFGVKAHKSKQHMLDEGKELIGPYCEKCDVKFLSEKAYDIHLRCSAKHLQGEDDPKRIRNEIGSADRPLRRRNDPIKYIGRFKKKKDEPRKKIPITKEPYVCEMCGKELRNFASYSLHLKHTHPGHSSGPLENPLEETPSWMCDTCGKMFRTKYTLNIHQLVHTGEKLFQCDHCGKKFCQKQGLKNHIQSQHLRSTNVHKCMLCDKVFTTRKNFKNHLINHLGLKPYPCELCPKKFASREGVHIHVRNVHSKNPWPSKKKKNFNEDIMNENE